jgi:hypothetical protein
MQHCGDFALSTLATEMQRCFVSVVELHVNNLNKCGVAQLCFYEQFLWPAKKKKKGMSSNKLSDILDKSEVS